MAKTLMPPFPWMGGKVWLAKRLAGNLPRHHTYVEVFGGAAAMLLAKPPSPVEVYNDIDSGLVNFFRVLRDEEKFERFLQLVTLTPYSREEYNAALGRWMDAESDVERAYLWYLVARMSFGGRFGSGWGMNVRESGKGMAKVTSAYLSAIERLPDIHERLMRVLIEHSDFRRILTIYDTPETLFYVDPPYVSETRRGGQYLYEMTERDHSDLVSLLLNVSGMAIVSGYKHKIYERLEEVGWKCFEIRKTCSLVGRTTAAGLQGRGSLSNQGRRECIWVSPNTMGEVDYEAIFKK